MYRVSHIILSGFYVLLPAALIFKQPNFGSFLILTSLWAGILIVSGIKLRHFLILFLLSIIFVTFSWFFLLGDYQKERIISFAQPTLEPLGIGWSQRQSQIAIGAGGIFGQGFGKGSQTQYGFLPESQTDFIFAAIGEEFGLLGAGFILLFFSFLIFRLFKIAVNSQLNFVRLFTLGFIFLLVSQAVVHIGMNLGLFPIIGLPLSFVSYGGSGLIIAYIMLGIAQAMGKKSL